MSHDLYKQLSKKREKSVIDHLMYFAAIVHPLMAVPQIYKIYSTHNVTGISLFTWLGFMFLGIIFLAYGIAHKMKPYIIMQLMWFVVDLSVVIGVILYS